MALVWKRDRYGHSYTEFIPEPAPKCPRCGRTMNVDFFSGKVSCSCGEYNNKEIDW